MTSSTALTVPAHDLYVSIASEGDHTTFGFGVSAKEARANLEDRANKRKKKVAVRDTDPKSTRNQSSGKRYKGLLVNISKSMAGYNELITLSGALAKTVTGPMTSHKITAFAKEKMDLIDEVDGVKTYGMRDEVTLDFVGLMEGNHSLISGFLFLPPAILMGCVSYYDSAYSDIIRIFLSLNPERFKNSDKTFSAAQLFEMKNLDEILNVIIESEVDSLMRGSHSLQIDFIDKSGKLKIRENHPNWGGFVEIFERRNIISHNNGVVNDIYVKNCKAAGFSKIPPLGSQAKLSRGYLRSSVGTLHEMLMMCLFELWNKSEKGQKADLYYGFSEAAFDLLKSKNYSMAAKILTYVLDKNDQGASEEARRMMAVNLAVAQKWSSDSASFEQALGRFQWDSSADKFKICVAAVREDVAGVKALMPRVRLSEDITARDFQTWPVFHWVRSNPDFLDCVRDTYGVQIQP